MKQRATRLPTWWHVSTTSRDRVAALSGLSVLDADVQTRIISAGVQLTSPQVVLGEKQA